MTDSTRLPILHELIAALDRRRPRVDPHAEAPIAEDAAALRAKAIEQIATLEDECASGRATKGRSA